MTWREEVIDGKNNWMLADDHAGGHVEQEDDVYDERSYHWYVWCFLSNNQIGSGTETTLEEAQRQVKFYIDDPPVERVHNWKYGL